MKNQWPISRFNFHKCSCSVPTRVAPREGVYYKSVSANRAFFPLVPSGVCHFLAREAPNFTTCPRTTFSLPILQIKRKQDNRKCFFNLRQIAKRINIFRVRFNLKITFWFNWFIYGKQTKKKILLGIVFLRYGKFGIKYLEYFTYTVLDIIGLTI